MDRWWTNSLSLAIKWRTPSTLLSLIPQTPPLPSTPATNLQLMHSASTLTSKSPFDDPKIETIAELFWRITDGHVGIVSTAFIADTTPAALTAHTRDRS